MGRTKGVIGRITGKDFDTTLKIDRACFGSDAMQRDQFTTLLAQEDITIHSVEIDKKMVGYCIHRCRFDSFEVLRLAIHPDYQRQGLGSQLLLRLVAKLSTDGKRRVALLVPDHLLGCHLFLKANGFRATCHGDEYYFMRGVRWNEQSLQTT